jgi:hypothetical protein
MRLTSVSLTLFAFIACASAYGGNGWGYYPPVYPTSPPSNTPPPSPPGTTTSPQCGPPGGCTCDCTCPPPSGGGNPCIPCPTPGSGNGTYPNNFTLTNDCIYNIQQACSSAFSAGQLISLVLQVVLNNLVSPILQILLVGNNTLNGAVVPLASLLCTILGIILCLLKNLGLLGIFGVGGLLGNLLGANAGLGSILGVLGGLG